MIKVEKNMLILDTTVSKQDAAAINEFLKIARRAEQERILNEINKLEEMSETTRTPLFQDTLLKKVREIVDVRD